MGKNTVMATNNFKAFATGAGANVMTQADWEALPALLSGFSSGKAASAQVNKAIRQASFIAAAVAQFVSTTGNVDVLDDGNLPGFTTKFGNAVSGRLINIRVLTSSGSYTPTAGTKKIKVTAIGGGGGSGGLPATSSTQFSASGGGAGGSAAVTLIDVSTLTFPLSYTIGAGGAAGAGSPITNSGGSGGNTTFGPLTAPGGGGSTYGPLVPQGSTNITGNAAPGAVATGGNILNMRGSAGGYAFLFGQGSLVISGSGGNSLLGSGGFGTGFTPPTRALGTGYGSGGSGIAIGSSAAAIDGTAGTPGVVIVEEYA